MKGMQRHEWSDGEEGMKSSGGRTFQAEWSAVQ